jgi:hypothetical protein
VNGVDWTNCPVASRPIPLSRTGAVSVPQTTINQANTLFPEGSSPNALLVNPNTDAFIVLQTASNVSFTFILEGAGYRNQFGYFLFDDTTRTVKPNPGYVAVFPDVSVASSMGSSGCMFAGVTTTVGPFPSGTVIGFWVRADGFNNANSPDFWVSYTTDVLTNRDGQRHIAWTKIDNRVIVGFEDLNNLGDKDYNDVMFYFTTDGNYTATDLVEYVNNTLQGCSDGEIVRYTEHLCTQFAVLEARNAQACQGYIRIPSNWILAPNDLTTRTAVLNNPSLFAKSDGSSFCMVLSDGTAVNNQWNSCAATSTPGVFSKDPTCFNVGCDKRLLIKGTTSLPTCTGNENQLCNPSLGSLVVSRTPSADLPGFSVLPLSFTVYISDLLAGSATLAYTLTSLPQNQQRFDVMVLLDTNNLASADFDTAKSHVNVMYNLLASKFATPPNIGFAIHSRTSSSAYRLDILSRLTTDSAQLSSIITAASSSQYASISQPRSNITQCVQTLASDTTIGWRGGNVFGAILVLSLTQQDSSSTLNNGLRDVLYTSGITPIYIVLPRTSNNPLSNYQSFVSSNNLNMGWAYQAATTQWSTLALSALDTYSLSIRFYRSPGTGSAFWGTTPSATTIASACVSGSCAFPSVVVRYPSGAAIGTYTFPLVATLVIPGYGTAQANIISNAAPTVTDAVFSLDEDTSRTFSLQAYANDVDKNLLRVSWVSLPAGAITASSTQVTTSANYDVATIFTFTPAANFNGQQTATFRVSDGCKNSTTATITFTVNPINDSPTATDASRTINEDTNADFDLSTLIADIDDLTSTLTPVIASLPANGRVLQLVGGSYTQVTASSTAVTQNIRFTPNLNWFGQTSFTYFVRDPANAVSATRTITITVTSVNDAPSCVSVTIAGTEDVAATLGAIAGSDVDGDSITVNLVSMTGAGSIIRTATSQTVTLPATNVVTSGLAYVPALNANGNVATISFTVSDGSATSSTCTATISLASVNDPPQASDFTATTPEDTPFTISFASSISDVETASASLVVTLVSRPDSAAGTLRATSSATTDLAAGAVLTVQSVYFIPRSNYNGQTTFTYRVSDGTLNSVERTVTVVVTPVNDAPTISTSSTSVIGVRGAASTFTVTIRDVDLGDAVKLMIGANTIQAATSSTGTLSYNSNAITPGNPITVVTNPNANGVDTTYTLSWTPGTLAPDNLSFSVTFFAQDTGQPAPSANSASITVVLSVQPNIAPVVKSGSTATIAEDNTLSAFVIRGDDPDGVAQSTSLNAFLVKLPDNGVLKQSGSVVTGQLGSRQTDSSSSFWNVDYVPNANFNGQDTFSFYLQDTLGAKSGTFLVTITVTPVNDAPTGSSFSVTMNEDTTYTITSFSGTDVDGDTLTLTVVSLPGKGTLQNKAGDNTNVVAGTNIAAANWALRYTPVANENGSPYTTLTFKLNDASSSSPTYTVTFNVLPINDAPVATSFTVNIDEDATSTVSFSSRISDVDNTNAELTVIVQSLPSSTLATLRQTSGSTTDIAAFTSLGQLSVFLSSVANAFGTTTFNYVVFDGSLTSNVGVVTVVIAAVNDVPTLSSQVSNAISARNQPVTIPLNMQDLDKNDAITLKVQTYSVTAGQGVLTLSGGSAITGVSDVVTRPNANGVNEVVNLVWTPSGTASNGVAGTVTFIVTDVGTPPPSASSNTLTITLSVATNVNPTINTNANITTPEDTPFNNYVITGTDSDSGEGNTLSGYIATLPANGKLFQGATEVTGALSSPSAGTSTTSFSLNYVPNADYNGADSFSYYFKDTPGGQSIVRTVYITVTPVNDAPTSQGFDVTTNEDTTYTFSEFVARDIDSTVFTLTITGLPAKGTLTLPSGTAVTLNANIASANWGLRYTPPANENAAADTVFTTFKFKVNDNATPSLSSPEYTVNVYVLPVNDPPAATDFSVTTPEDNPLTISLASPRISDPDNAPATLIVTIKNRPSSAAGTLRVDSSSSVDIDSVTPLSVQSIYFIPRLNYNGPATFTYSVSDGSLSSVDRTVSITVSPVNDVPTVATSTTSVVATRTVASNFTVTVRDVDIGDVVATLIGTNTLVAASSTTGTVVVGTTTLVPATQISVASYSNPDGASSTVNLAWTPGALAPDSLQVSLAFFARDVGQPAPSASSATQTVVLRVAANNPPTTVDPGTQTTNEDTNKQISLSGTDLDVVTNEQRTLTVFITSLPTNGRLQHNSVFLTTENSALSVKTSDSTSTTSVVTYVPNANYNGPDSFGFYVVDVLSAKSSPRTVSITVNPMNDAPTTKAVTATGNEDELFLITGFFAEDIDGDDITYVIESAPAKGDLYDDGDIITSFPKSISSSDISLLGFKGDLNEFNSPYTTFPFHVSDGEGGFSATFTGTVNVLPVNDAPVADGDDFSLNEDATLQIDFNDYISDVDNTDAQLTVVIGSLPTNGKLLFGANTVAVIGTTFTSSKTFTYKPNDNFNGEDSFTWYVLDTANARDDATFNFDIAAINDPPASANIVVSTFRGIPVDITEFIVQDIDDDLSGITLSLLSGEGIGTISDDDGATELTLPETYDSSSVWKFTWTPPTIIQFYPETTAVAQYKFKLNDGDADSVEYTITVNLIYSNYAPFGEDSLTTTPEDTPVAITLDARDYESSLENLKTIIVSVDNSNQGKFYLDAEFTQLVVPGEDMPTKTLWFVPDLNAFSSGRPLGRFTYVVKDEGNERSRIHDGVVYVSPVNDPPTYGGVLTFDVLEDTNLDMTFVSQIFDVDSELNATLTITTGVERGQLYECTGAAATCDRVPLTSGSVVVNVDKRVSFVPALNENGQAYATFSFILTDAEGTVSVPYNITINVIPVNDPPTIIPAYNTLPGRVDFDEDTEYVLSWTVTDVDSALADIVVKITSDMPSNAKLYMCDTTDGAECNRGEEISTPAIVASVSEGAYKVLYVPDQNSYDARNFGQFNLIAQDDFDLPSAPVKAIIRVLPINDAPLISTQYGSRTAYPGQDGIPIVTLNDVDLIDIDSGKNKIDLFISCSVGSIQVLADGAFENRTSGSRVIEAPCTVITDSNGFPGVKCHAPQDQLNEVYLHSTKISFEGIETAAYQVFITVDDLGNTDKEDRPLSSQLILSVTPQSNLITDNDGVTDNTLTIALSVSAAAAVGLVIGVIFGVRRKYKAAGVDDYFDNITNNANSASTSAIYAGRFQDGVNPFYEQNAGATN